MNKPIVFMFCVFLSGCSLLAEDTFKQAIEPRTLIFPKDHGSHAGFQTEWWYLTGNLKDETGREFGYQFTVFRRAINPRSSVERGRTSAWAVSDLYVGHLAISDIGGHQFISAEESRRGVLDIAGATDAAESAGNPIRVWLGQWELLRTEHGWTVKANGNSDIALDLALIETMAPVSHGRPGEEGLSHKGPAPGQASYYYSVPQINTTGEIRIKGTRYKIVSGRSWMDHEFGSNQLSSAQAGWDWFAVELDDGSAFMLYVLRNTDGTIEPRSAGTWVDKTGKALFVPIDQVKITRGREWTSPATQGRYTQEWRVELPKLNVSFEIKTAQDDQEMRGAKFTGIAYYEGAIHVEANVGGQKVNGSGYLEITGAPGQKQSETRWLGGLM